MNWAPLVYLGRVSYGLYILHPYMPDMVGKVFRLLRLPSVAPLGPIFLLGLNLTALIALCSLSWHFFEKKINNLKRFFPYVSPPRAMGIRSQSRDALPGSTSGLPQLAPTLRKDGPAH
jgi:peptidoglycan/LPS O-acetylase OafA/YrhL